MSTGKAAVPRAEAYSPFTSPNALFLNAPSGAEQSGWGTGTLHCLI